MVTIAPLSAADRDDWLPLWRGYLDFYEAELDDDTTATTFARLVDPVAGIHGALARDDDGAALGLVHWLCHPATWATADYCYLEDLYVAPAAREAGAGAALIEHVRVWAEQNGAAKVYWLTAETNGRARALYDRVSTRTGMIHYQITPA
ncbi:GNAT family N-acetyltransferase [Microbacterium sp. NPDC089987]|uniref:GNAT family N-acetyltransferase n=1 Tax=Microbacterium sp. NPDC089987 TaxID=3364202 RepID=UPI0037F6C7BC